MKNIYKLYTKNLTCTKLIIKINKYINFLNQNENILIISDNLLFIIEIKIFIIRNDIIIKQWNKNKKQYILIKLKNL
ncbi:MAG: hypothetical protein HYZ30_00020 [Candidatus Azosocius agrarius]|nr:MAG: hypothetical protein HYZ30_00020 [Gammaproteobacteria bacterium]